MPKIIAQSLVQKSFEPEKISLDRRPAKNDIVIYGGIASRASAKGPALSGRGSLPALTRL